MEEMFFFFRQIDKLRRCELITEKEVKQLCAKARYVCNLISLFHFLSHFITIVMNETAK